MTDRVRRRSMVVKAESIHNGGRVPRKDRDPTFVLPALSPVAVRFSDSELASLHVAFRSGARGCVLIAARHGERVLTFALPPARTEVALYRQVSEGAKRLRSVGCDGWLLARRATARFPPPQPSRIPSVGLSVLVMLVQEQVRFPDGGYRSRSLISRLDGGDAPTFYEWGDVGGGDRIVRLLSEACCHT